MVNYKYVYIFLIIIILSSCTDRDTIPNPPDRYDDVYSFSEEIDPEDAKILYEQYLRERMELESKYREKLAVSNIVKSRQKERNINQEVWSYGRVNLPELMDALKQVQEEVRRQNLFVDELSNTLNELGRDPNADEKGEFATSVRHE